MLSGQNIKRAMMNTCNYTPGIAFYSTSDVKTRLRIKSTQTLKAYRDNKGFPEPVISSYGARALYSAQAVHMWEQAQLLKMVG
jgi:hypothetical protein